VADQVEFKAMDADFLLKHPVLAAAFDSVREDFVAQIEDGLPDRATQDGVMIGLQALKAIKNKLQDYINDAAMDRHTLETEEY
jgi:hypothetical protein